jgi:hypothetical protein
MSLDGWSLQQKINKVREELLAEIQDLKLHFSTLYEYLRHMEDIKESSKGVKKNAKKQRRNPTIH